ncbi:MAG: tRNA 2-thiouridine(34) synthase MnmA [Bdellovibrionales bacterium]|nr:tRNA 2-thiouridine(34) synthase MnmA [Bdellovibrionales bacterium]
MSGGVDSSVAAALLVEQGYEVIGVTMQVWDYSECNIEEGMGTCCSSEDVDDARAVADRLDIPFYVLNCESEFKSQVIDPFVQSYMGGKTPLPCVNCNTYLKFDHLIFKMKELGCDYLATGHYAHIERGESGRWGIVTSADSWKDQTYFLFTIEPSIIDRLLFPVGGMTKKEVREYAEKNDLIVAKKKDSTGICFIDNSGYGAFIDKNYPQLAAKKGKIRRYPEGEVLGDHEGIHYFTYGQRKGLGISSDRPLYVIKVDVETGDVWVGEEKDLYSKAMEIADCHWLDEMKDEIYQVKIRYSQKGADAHLIPLEDGRYRVEFVNEQRAVTPGQAAVFYKGHRLMGGGWIL